MILSCGSCTRPYYSNLGCEYCDNCRRPQSDNSFDQLDNAQAFLRTCKEHKSSLGTDKKDAPVGLRYDDNKPRMDLLSPVALEGISSVLSYGCRKYSENNWKAGMKWGRVVASLLRHTFKFLSGENLDKESGLPHVDHIATNAMFLSEYYRTRPELDDRYVEPANKQSGAV